jgi:16S rRNA processing protein RimM
LQQIFVFKEILHLLNEREIMEDILQVGAIANTHGVRGEAKVFPMTDDVQRFKKLKSVLLETKNGYRELEVTSARFFKNMVIVKFKGIDTMDEIEKYKGCGLFVTRENAVKLKKDEYFIADLIGLRVCTEDGEELGTLRDVLTTGANDVYVVARSGAKDLMIPAIRDCIVNISIEEGTMTVHLLDGLLDL